MYNLSYVSAMQTFYIFVCSVVLLLQITDSSVIVTKSMIHTPGEIYNGSRTHDKVNGTSKIFNNSSSLFYEPIHLNSTEFVENIISENNIKLNHNFSLNNRGYSVTKLYPVNDTKVFSKNSSTDLKVRKAKLINEKATDLDYQPYEKIPDDYFNYYQKNMTQIQNTSHPEEELDNNDNNVPDSHRDLYSMFWDELKNVSLHYLIRAACDNDNMDCEEQYRERINQDKQLNIAQVLRSTEVKLQILSFLTNVYNCLWSYGPMDCVLRGFYNEDIEAHEYSNGERKEIEEEYYTDEIYVTETERKNDENTEEGKGKGSMKVHHKLLQPLLLFLLKLKLFMIPTVAGLALLSGKALSFSFVALLLSVLLGSTHRMSDIWHGATKRQEVGLQPQQHDFQTHTEYYMR